MSMFLKLNKVTGYRHDPYAEDPTEELPTEPETTSPVTINATMIKSMYPRKHGRRGTRINFVGGQGFAVKELKEEIDSLLITVGAQMAGEHPVAEVVTLPQPETTAVN